MAKITIVDGNDEIELSTAPKENIKAYMVKGEPGEDAISPTITTSRSGKITTITIVDKDGTKVADINDGYDPTITTTETTGKVDISVTDVNGTRTTTISDPVVTATKTDRTATVSITDADGTRTTEIYDGLDMTGGVPTDGVLGWDNDDLSYTCDGTETGDYYLTYNSVDYYFTMPTIEVGDILLFDTTNLELLLNGTTITTATSGTGTELTFVEYIPNGYELTNEPFPGAGSITVHDSYSTSTTEPYSANYLNDKIVNVGSTIDDDYRVNFIKGKNLFSGFKNGAYNSTTGIFDGSTSGISSEKIGVISGEKYTLSGFNDGPTIRVLFWNNDTFISSTTLTATTSNTITMLGNYFAFQTAVSVTYSNMQLEKGEEKTSYEAFIPNSINVDGYKFTETIGVGTNVDSRNRVNVLHSKNLFNKDSWSKNYINPTNGAITSSNNAALFSYIEVAPSTEYTISLSSTVNDCKVAYYTSSQTWISSSASITTTTTFTTPSNTKYIRIYINVDGNGIDQTKIDNLNCQVEVGTTATTYEPYITPSINVDGEEIYSKDNFEQYSTNEIRIGTWIDGKPLYRKVIQTTMPTVSTDGTYVSKQVGIGSSISYCYVARAIMEISGQYYTLPYLNNAGRIAKCFTDLSSINLVANGTAFSDGSVIVVVEYTKTTD